MTATSHIDPSQRQILVNVGNRYVVFGQEAGLPQQLLFDPETDSDDLPRGADENEFAEDRIVQTVRVSGMTKEPVIDELASADFALLDADRNHFLVDVKVRESQPKQRDFQQWSERLAAAAKAGEKLEIWAFNTEQLKLTIMHQENSGSRFDELVPLDVWEKTPNGILRRVEVVQAVDDWAHRVADLYKTIQNWLGERPDLRCEQNRSVTMSEDLMQKFAVADRELPVLDVSDSNQTLASFVPRGLWLIGSRGRIDIITPVRTLFLHALRNEHKTGFVWRLFSPDNPRKGTLFDKTALLHLLALQ